MVHTDTIKLVENKKCVEFSRSKWEIPLKKETKI